MYGQNFSFGIIKGKNDISLNWINQKRHFHNKSLISYEEWENFINYLSSKFVSTDKESGLIAFNNSCFTITLFLKSEKQFNYFLYLLINFESKS